MAKKILTTPLSEQAIRELTIGDVIYLNGTLVTCRDSGHRRVVDENRFPTKCSFKDNAIFHAGPIVKTLDDGSFQMISIGPTTSRRMESYEAEFIEKTGVRMVVGKGGMMQKTQAACQKFGAVHCVFPGGCALVAAESVEKVEALEWEDFGMPEALWIMKVREFGPLIVSVDTKGNNLFENNKIAFKERMQAALNKKI